MLERNEKEEIEKKEKGKLIAIEEDNKDNFDR